MTTAAATLLADAFDRIQQVVHAVLDGLDARALAVRVDQDANPIGWLLWHLTRVQDDHVSDLAGTEQQWRQGWSERFGLPYDDDAIGYGQSSAEIGKFSVTDPALLAGYHDAVHDATVNYLQGLSDADLDRVVDENWDPPVTLGVRLVSVVSDDLQHAGQASYVRGLVERRPAS